jgi:DNA-binding NarL/FixJ family response regulator
MTSILVVDDDPFFLEGLCLYLRMKGHSVYECGCVQDALQIASLHAPEAAIIDILIPEAPHETLAFYRPKHYGISLAQNLKAQYPTIALVLFSAFADFKGHIFNLLKNDRMGGLGYQLKGAPPHVLYETLQRVQLGHTVIDPAVTNRSDLYEQVRQTWSPLEVDYIDFAVQEFASLTPREQEVARLIASSYTQKAIADRLFIVEGAVEGHTNIIYQKLGLHRLAKTAGLRPQMVLAKAVLLLDLT